MKVKTTAVYDIFKKRVTAKGLKFPGGAYLCYTHRALNGDGSEYTSETAYPINKGENTTIPNTVANSPEFQQLFTLGYLEEVI